MKRSGFTLVEMLVSMAVFLAVASIMGAILGNVATSGRRNEGQQRISSAFRTATDRFQADWQGAVRHRGYLPVFEKNEGNDQAHFYSQVRTPRMTTDIGRLVRVSYFVDLSDAVSAMREVEPVGWESLMDSPVPSSAPPPGVVVEAAGTGIFRMEIAFQRDDGQLTAAPPPDLTKLRALVIGYAALDPDSLSRLSTTQRAALAGMLSDCPDTGALPGDDWKPADFAEMPPFIAENVRFYQRWFPVQ